MRKLRSPQRPLASSWSVLPTFCWWSSFSPPRPPGSNFRGCWSCALQRRGRIARCRWSECFYRVTASDHVWTKAAACKLPLLWSVAILPSGTFSHHTAPGHLRPLSPSLSRIVVCVLQVSGGPWVRKMFRMNPQPSLKDSLVTFLWRKA